MITVKTKELYGVPVTAIKQHIREVGEDGFQCLRCGDLFPTLELACQHLRAFSDIKPHPYIARALLCSICRRPVVDGRWHEHAAE